MICRQLLDEEHQDIQLPHRAECFGDFSETAGEPVAHIALQLQERDDFTKPARSHARSV